MAEKKVRKRRPAGPPPEWAKRITEARKRAGFRFMRDLAESIGVVENTVGRWEMGKNKPGTESMAAIARACHVPLDWLHFGGELAEGPLPEPVYPPVLARFFRETPEGQAAPRHVREVMRGVIERALPGLEYDRAKLRSLLTIAEDFPELPPPDQVAAADFTAERSKKP